MLYVSPKTNIISTTHTTPVSHMNMTKAAVSAAINMNTALIVAVVITRFVAIVVTIPTSDIRAFPQGANQT